MPDFQRFRRSKTKKAAMSPSSSPVPSPSTTLRTSAEGKLAPPARDSPPTLTISTSTTPPRASHSSHSPHSFIPPKSPFRNLKFPRSSHKRARSPAPASLQPSASPAVVNHDGSLDHAMTSSPAQNRSVGTDGVLPDGRKIPAFLTLSEQDIATKFADITWSEQIRTVQGMRDTSAKFGPIDPAFKNLNRYQNVQPWEHNRVKLQVPEGAPDYINASPIVLESPLKPKERPPHKYIAMQGPKPNTQDHVWRMVSQQLQSPAVIVMLTETHENAMEKCHPYFPDAVDDVLNVGEDDEFGDGFRAQVTCVGMEDKAHGAIVMRHLKMHVEGRDDGMDVWHLLYKKWPDFGVPALEDIDSFFELMRLSRAKNASGDNPRVVHCSAGVGRSGTFIALEHLMREVESGDLEHYDENNGGDEAPDLVFDTVSELREQRKMMVQAEPQYLFIYKVLRKLWTERYGVADESGEPASKRLGVDNDPFVEETND